MAAGTPPSGTVTFLFTDVEGSTRLWERAPDAMASAIERHDAILRSRIEHHGGYVFTTAGDSFAAAFDRVANAIAAAIEIRERLRDEPWDPAAPVRVRIGLHTGEARERDGDYFGPDVNLAARLMSAAHADQIVASDTTAAIAGRGTADLRELGEHALKDVAGPVRVWQLGEGEFPPLVTSGHRSHNLAAPLVRLVGRGREREELTGLLRTESLVTVIGPGGVGKSLLAKDVAADQVGGSTHGVWVVDMASCDGTLDSIGAAIGGVLDFDVRDGDTWEDTAVASLSVRNLLLVLDNCDHVVRAVARFADRMLASAPHVKVLATSRERLDVRGERVYPLGRLEAGPELFAATAVALDPAFDPTTSQASIQSICDRLDGLPLAIELAAARIRTMRPDEIDARLENRFRLLRSRDRTRDDRQQSLEATLDWSYEQLPPASRSLFARLGVFNGLFDLDAAAGVADPELDELDVADMLADLEAKSLISTVASAGTTRYRLLETMAEYARHRLRESELLDDTQRRHAAMRAAVTRRRTQGLLESGHDHAALFGSLLADQDDITTAFTWALEHDHDVAADLLTALRPLIGSLGGLGLSTASRFAATVAIDEYATVFSDLDRALAAFVLVNSGSEQQAEEVVAAMLDRSDLTPDALGVLLTVASHNETVLRNNTERGIELADAAVVAAESIADPLALSFVRSMAPVQHFQAGNIERAVELVTENEALPGMVRTGSPGLLMLYAAGVCFRPRDIARSNHYLELCHQGLVAMGDHKSAAFLQYHLALNKLVTREDREARSALAAALPGMVDRGQTLAFGLMFEDLALAFARTGESTAAVLSFSVADRQLATCNETGYDMYVRRREHLLPRLRREVGDGRFETTWSEGQLLALDEAVLRLQALASA